MKKEEAKEKTTSALLKIAREHFTQVGYYEVSLEKISAEGNVTRGAVYHHFKSKKGLFLAVLDIVQKDVALEIEREAMKSEDVWQQLLLGCMGFIKGANAKDCRRILLVDAPVVAGWDAWRKADRENSLSVLHKHIDELKRQGYLKETVDTKFMACSVSGALNELALTYPLQETAQTNAAIAVTIAQLVHGFKKGS